MLLQNLEEDYSECNSYGFSLCLKSRLTCTAIFSGTLVYWQKV